MKIAGSKEDRQRIHPREVWDAAIKDYLHADATASAIERHYGIREPTFRKRLSREGITKIGRPVVGGLAPPAL